MVGGWVGDLVNVRGGPSIFFGGPSRPSAEGRRRKKKMKATFIWQIIKKVPTYLFFFLIFEIFFMAFLCVSQQGEFKNTIKNFLGKSMSKAFGRKS